MAVVNTKCTDLDILKEVLKDMGFEVINSSGSVKAMDGKTTQVVAQVKNQSFGIRKDKDKDGASTYSLAGEFYRTDWYLKERQLAAHVNREYAFKKVIKENEAKGFRMKPGSLKIDPKTQTKVFIMQKM